MESDDDLIFSSSVEAVQSPIQQTTFKRLKKASKFSQIPNVEILFSSKSVTDSGGEDLLEERLVSPVGAPSLIFETVNAFGSIANSGPIDETNFIEDNSASPIGSFSGSDNFENELEIHENAEFSEELKALSQETNGKLGSSDDCPQASQERSNDGCYASGENADGLEKRPAKKRGSRDGEEGKGRKKKVYSTDGEAKYEASERTKLKLAKERKSDLDMIHVESQRLLRETRGASFKPAHIVQKPISSVLEKIRKRKLEVLKKPHSSDSSGSFMNNDALLGDTVQFGSQCAKTDCRQDGGNDDQDGGLPTTNAGDGFSTAPENILSNTVSDSKGDLETQDPISSALEELIREKDNGKENIDPHRGGDPVKAFVDDEAEEEHDSDNE